MSFYLKSAVENLNAHIQELVTMRDNLASLADPQRTTAAVETRGEPTTPETARRMVTTLKALQRAESKSGGAKSVAKVKPESKPAAKQPESVEMSPMAPAMLAAGRALPEPFDTAALTAATECGKKEASNALVRWKMKGWVQCVARGEYRRLKSFPQFEDLPDPRAGEKLLASIHEEIAAAKPKD